MLIRGDVDSTLFICKNKILVNMLPIISFTYECRVCNNWDGKSENSICNSKDSNECMSQNVNSQCQIWLDLSSRYAVAFIFVHVMWCSLMCFARSKYEKWENDLPSRLTMTSGEDLLCNFSSNQSEHAEKGKKGVVGKID